jgi:hypothetical protein
MGECVICVTGRLPEGWEEEVLGVLPRIAVEGEGGSSRVWADGKGLRADAVTRSLVKRLGGHARAGVAFVPIAAWAAAGTAVNGEVIVVPEGNERAFLAPLSIAVLETDEWLRLLLEGAGVERCGELAAIPREAVEVRFGGEAVKPWQWSRGEDMRRLFQFARPEPPHASIDFVDYVVTDPERLLFTVNALLGPLCESLTESGAHARRMVLTLPLANGTIWNHTLKPARATASRITWLRLARTILERLTVPDSVTGVALRMEATEPAAAVQGDLFDAGFGTASLVEAALARLLESQGDVVVQPEPNAHPLAEKRSVFTVDTNTLAGVPVAADNSSGGGLTLQLLPQPRAIRVETARRRDHDVPVRYRDRIWQLLVTAAGPERVSGGQWDAPYAREYFRCVTDEGVLVWLYRDAAEDRWYLHGWWD